MVAVGIADGAATAAVGITHLVRRSIRLVGSYGGRTRTDMPALIRLVEAGAVTSTPRSARGCRWRRPAGLPGPGPRRDRRPRAGRAVSRRAWTTR